MCVSPIQQLGPQQIPLWVEKPGTAQLLSVPVSHLKQRSEWQNRLGTRLCGRLPYFDKEIVNIPTIQASLVQIIFCIIQNKLEVLLWSCRKIPHLISIYQNTGMLPGFQCLQHFREHFKYLKNFEMNPIRKGGTLFYIPFTSQFIFPELFQVPVLFSIIRNPVMIQSLCEIMVSGAFLSNPLNKITRNFRISSF